jgi:malonyl-CoA/methylmalonyl-CoA synthetase
VRQVDDKGAPVPPGEPGELQVKGPGVFLEYWQRPEETARSFVDGWFATGDLAVLEQGGYRIFGRKSTDIIKTGGFKVSALEIEEALRGHPAVAECAVVGLEDPEWGERVCAALVLRPGETLSLDGLRAWAKKRLAPYKVPTRMLTVDDLPRNAMGKVTKPEVRAIFAVKPA